MISHLELQNFRGLEHVKFENLGRVNLIVGGNNVGKTSILEALILLYGNQTQLASLPTTFRILPQNGQDNNAGTWRHLVGSESIASFRLKSDGESVMGTINGNGNWIFKFNSVSNVANRAVIELPERGSVAIQSNKLKSEMSILSTRQEDPYVISELFNQIAPLNPENEEKLENLLQNSIEPRLKRLRYAKLKGNNTHLVYVDLGVGKMLPFTQMGQAFARTLQVYCEIFAQRPIMLLIDEIENGLYYEGMEDYWKGLMAVLEDQDVQLFATTHSRECMEAAYRAAKDMPNDPLRYLRLDRRIDDPAKIVATTFGKEEMATAIEFNREMR